MKKVVILIILFALFVANNLLFAQESKLVVLNLKNGYSVKGEIIEQSEKVVKIKLLNGEIFEYNTDEISSSSSTNTKKSSSSNKMFSPTKVVPQVIAKGDIIMNIGIVSLKEPSNSDSEKLTIPPIPISFEYIVKNDLFNGNGALGIGGFVGYTAAKRGGDKDSRFIIGARGYVHYAIVEKLDTYTGALFGHKSDISKSNGGDRHDEKSSEVKPTLNVFAGCRYFFNDKIAGMAELGWGISIVTIGVAIKL